MTKRGRYILIEATIGAAFSAGLSLFFVLLLFGGDARVAVWGMHGIVSDAVPQSFMIVLMSSLVPRLLLRHRLATERIHGVTPHGGVGAILLQSAALALAVTAALVLLQALALSLATPDTWPLRAVIAYKLGYGVALGAATAGRVVARGLDTAHAGPRSPSRLPGTS